MNFQEFLKDILGYLAIIVFAALMVVAIMMSPSALATPTSSHEGRYTHPALVDSAYPIVYYSRYMHW